MANYLPRVLREESPGAIPARFGMILQDFPRCCGLFVLHSLPGSRMQGHPTNRQMARDEEIIEYLKGGALNLLIEENPVEGALVPKEGVDIVAVSIPEYGNDKFFTAAGWTPLLNSTNGIWAKKDMILFHKKVPLPTATEREKWGKKVT